MHRAAVDVVLIVYLFSHGILALLIDVQAILPDMLAGVYELYKHAGLTAVVQQWVDQQGDILMESRPPWFKAIVVGEIIFQCPLSLALGYGWLTKAQWARIPGLIYCVHVMTTMIPIMSELCIDERPTLLCKVTYGIWILLPAIMLLRCLQQPPLFEERARTVWKIASLEDVQAWETCGLLSGSPLDLKDGFIHGSDASMIRQVAQLFFRGQEVSQMHALVMFTLQLNSTTT